MAQINGSNLAKGKRKTKDTARIATEGSSVNNKDHKGKHHANVALAECQESKAGTTRSRWRRFVKNLKIFFSSLAETCLARMDTVLAGVCALSGDAPQHALDGVLS